MKCSLCGQSAGWFKRVHRQCADRHRGAISQLVEMWTRYGLTGEPENAGEQARKIGAESFVTENDQANAQIAGANGAIEQFLARGSSPGSNEIEGRLIKISQLISIDSPGFQQSEQYTKLLMNAVLNDVRRSQPPRWSNVGSGTRFNFQKDEYPIWIFDQTRYLEEKTFRHYEGRSRGVSVRIAKGVYYRTGSSKGYPVDETRTVAIDTGATAFTNNRIYFAGSHKGFRIPYEKIATFDHYSDGLKIVRDSTTAKPQIFITGNGWFISKLFEIILQ